MSAARKPASSSRSRFMPSMATDEIDVVADRIVAGGRRSKDDVLRGRMPVVRSRSIEQLEETGQGLVARMEEGGTTGSGMPDSASASPRGCARIRQDPVALN